MNNFPIILFFLQRLQKRLERIEISSPSLARWICRVIPASCPFEREIKLGSYTLLSIPPLCKLNPFYDQLMLLRFKSLTYLAEECHEDLTLYC
ncbi:Mo-dependent nitrogenase C-terminal domain-containing protein [Pleurocapsa sp. PCC 7319]|uniref:Mo-dependent nitrogenase C-terminal domain-containing protein n=1 Tax=Pleurocapsa sp. PCC 7319 TaxID=118161 RepID=UPI0004776815|nr:Mo-dependent nitrogenase C-terminal domain-containing protein [Pleurocapsa sp. PCC 7319]